MSDKKVSIIYVWFLGVLLVALSIISVFLTSKYIEQSKQYYLSQELSQQLLFNTVKDMINYSKGDAIDYKVIYISSKFINDSHLINVALENTELSNKKGHIENLFGKIQGLAFRSMEGHTVDTWSEILDKLNKFIYTLPPDTDKEQNYIIFGLESISWTQKS